MSLGFTPLGDRVVIRADVEQRAPEQTDSGLYLAQTLTAAVEGDDRGESWFVGTVVAIGPLVQRFEIRPWLQRKFQEIDPGYRYLDELFVALREEFEALPADCPDPVKVGDRVCFSWASGQELLVDGDKFVILRASEVLAVLDPESEAA